MIAIMLFLGPAHGKTIYVNGSEPLQKQMFAVEPVGPSFQPYVAGEPFGPPRTSMMTGRHIYTLLDVFDHGVEEGAVYIHDEDCCDKSYERSDNFKDAFPHGPNREYAPRIMDAPDPRGRQEPRRNRPKSTSFGDPQREPGHILPPELRGELPKEVKDFFGIDGYRTSGPVSAPYPLEDVVDLLNGMSIAEEVDKKVQEVLKKEKEQ